MTATSTYPISIKGVLRVPTGEVVLLLNEREEWELPGGRIERGESSAECLIREIAEELNLRVEVGDPIDTYLFEVVQELQFRVWDYGALVLLSPARDPLKHVLQKTLKQRAS